MTIESGAPRMNGCAHKWDKIGYQPRGSHRYCNRCGITQEKRARAEGFHLVEYWSLSYSRKVPA